MFRFLTDIANLNRSKSWFFGADGRYYYIIIIALLVVNWKQAVLTLAYHHVVILR